jgi:hypothetical protein
LLYVVKTFLLKLIKAEKYKYFVKFLNSNVSSPTPSSIYATSTYGTYSDINKAAGVAKKPGQRKRPVNAKTSKRH